METIRIISLVLSIISLSSLSFIGGYSLGKYKEGQLLREWFEGKLKVERRLADVRAETKNSNIESEDKTLGQQNTTENNACQSCIHKAVCKFNTNDRCNEYEIGNICDFCSKANSCEVKDYPVSKCRQYYYNRTLNRMESEE